MQFNIKKILSSSIVGILLLVNINSLNNDENLLANGRVKSYITKNTELYEISLGISPDPLQKGIGHLVIIIKDKNTDQFINDATVKIQLNHRATTQIIGPLNLTNLSSIEPLSLNEYDIDLVLTETGIWDLYIQIQKGNSYNELIHEIKVVKPNPIAALSGVFVLTILLLILIYSIYSQIKMKKQS
ncbi:MAG: hypothetical protein CL758_08485 [Chloroflexi bacterium]|nr:hypothetical protein [Chloroflexota bacterium]|tara:strand:+ start:4807 stop:5364 length:558 start_codon:yes stop_codon:yes gene_type:complete